MQAHLWILSSVTIALCACGAPELEKEGKALFPVRNQCFSVIGGEETKDFPSTVVLLTSANLGVSQCTGTFISDQLLVTAAHCVEKDNPTSVTAVIDDCENSTSIPVRSEQIWYTTYAGTDFGGEQMDLEKAAFDVALVQFPAGSAPATSALATAPWNQGVQATMVGFGAVDYSDAEQQKGGFEDIVKKKGDIVSIIDGNASDLLTYVAKKNEAALAKGDSGGPLFIDAALIGVASFGSHASDTFNISGWVNLLSAKSFELLARVQEETGGIADWDAFVKAHEIALKATEAEEAE